MSDPPGKSESNQQKERGELFRREWVRWQPQVYAYLRTLIFNRADAEDLLQEVAEVLWKKIDQFQRGTRFDQWAIAVARNLVLNFQKKKARERVRFSESFEELLAADAEVSATSGRDLIGDLESCVAKLPKEHRELLRQRYEPKGTNRSVAHATGKSESTISRTLTVIYERLMLCIETNS